MSSARIRVMEVSGSLHPGGAEKVVAHLVNGIDSSRFEMRVYCTRELGSIGEALRTNGITVEVGGAGNRLQRYLTPVGLLRAVRRFRPHLVHTHGLIAMSAAGPLAALGLLPRWMHTFHFGNYPYPLARRMAMERRMSGRCDDLVAVSHAQREAIALHHRIPADRMQVIWNGVQANPHVGNAATRAKKRAELGIDDDALVIGSVAVLTEQKGIPYLLEAARTVCASRTTAKFLIVGGGHDDAQRRYSQMARDLGVADKVIFAGWRSDIPELLAAMDIYVMSSLWEAMPLALLEAMAATLPIVVTDVGDNARLVSPQAGAIVVPPRNGEAIATAIDSLAQSPELRVSMGQRSASDFRERFTVEHMLQAYQAAFERGVVAGRGSVASQ